MAGGGGGGFETLSRNLTSMLSLSMRLSKVEIHTFESEERKLYYNYSIIVRCLYHKNSSLTMQSITPKLIANYVSIRGLAVLHAGDSPKQGRREPARTPGEGHHCRPQQVPQEKGHHVHKCPIFLSKSDEQKKRCSSCDGALSCQTCQAPQKMTGPSTLYPPAPPFQWR